MAVGATPVDVQANLPVGADYHLVNLGAGAVRIARGPDPEAPVSSEMLEPRRSVAEGRREPYPFLNEPDFPDNALWVSSPSGAASVRIKPARPRI